MTRNLFNFGGEVHDASSKTVNASFVLNPMPCKSDEFCSVLEKYLTSAGFEAYCESNSDTKDMTNKELFINIIKTMSERESMVKNSSKRTVNVAHDHYKKYGADTKLSSAFVLDSYESDKKDNISCRYEHIFSDDIEYLCTNHSFRIFYNEKDEEYGFDIEMPYLEVVSSYHLSDDDINNDNVFTSDYGATLDATKIKLTRHGSSNLYSVSLCNEKLDKGGIMNFIIDLEKSAREIDKLNNLSQINIKHAWIKVDESNDIILELCLADECM